MKERRLFLADRKLSYCISATKVLAIKGLVNVKFSNIEEL